MEALRRYLGLGPVVSIGMSYGGKVAMAHAARHPKAISHLVLVATAAHHGSLERARQIVAERGTPEQSLVCEALWNGTFKDAVHMFTKPTGIFINPATCASTIAGTLRGRRRAPPPGGEAAPGGSRVLRFWV